MRTFANNLTVCAVFLTLVSGCAHRAAIPPAPTDVRDSYGTIGLVVQAYEHSQKAEKPVGGAGKGAATGAGTGALVLGGGLASGPLGWILGIVLAPPVAIVGGIYGAVRAHPKAEVQAADAVIQSVWSSVEPSSLIKTHFLDVAKGYADRVHIKPLTGQEAINPKTLDALEIDTVVTLKISSLHLMFDGLYEPDVSLVLSVDASVARASDSQKPYNRIWEYMSEEADYFDLAANGAQDLRGAVDVAFEKMAKKIALDLFASRETEYKKKEAADKLERGFVRVFSSSTDTEGRSAR